MRRTLRLLLCLSALVAAAAAFTACGGDDGGAGVTACVEHDDCAELPRGHFCSLDGVCVQQECRTAGDCPGTGLVCLDNGLCGPKECEESAAPGEEGSCPAGYFCERGACKQDTGPAPDVVEPGDAGGDDDTAAPVDVVPEVEVPTDVAACTACTEDADCGEGKTCEQLGASKHCVAACADDSTCAAGWVCYPLTNEGNACVPAAFKCDAACLAAGCPDGQVCDQVDTSATFGQCVAEKGECATCSADWECGAGFRCGTSAGGLRFCLPECANGTCPTWGACAEKGGLGGEGVMICRPTHPTCCGPDCVEETCEEECTGLTPVCKNGVCVQCDSDDDCPNAGQTCDAVTYRCTGGPCAGTPSTPFEFQGSCVQCLQDSHCGANGTCDQGTHTCAGGDPCGGVCVDPYPGCAVINQVPSCVPCTEDAHCPGGTCNTTTYSCEGGLNGGGCAGDCLLAGCPNTTGQFDLVCDNETGCCYDQTGLCDGVEAFCPPSSECKSIFEIFAGGAIPGGGIPGMPTDAFAGGMCTCDAIIGGACGLMGWPESCDNVPRCPGDVGCLPISSAIQLLTQLGGGGAGGAVLFEGDVCMDLGL